MSDALARALDTACSAIGDAIEELETYDDELWERSHSEDRRRVVRAQITMLQHAGGITAAIGSDWPMPQPPPYPADDEGRPVGGGYARQPVTDWNPGDPNVVTFTPGSLPGVKMHVDFQHGKDQPDPELLVVCPRCGAEHREIKLNSSGCPDCRHEGPLDDELTISARLLRIERALGWEPPIVDVADRALAAFATQNSDLLPGPGFGLPAGVVRIAKDTVWDARPGEPFQTRPLADFLCPGSPDDPTPPGAVAQHDWAPSGSGECCRLCLAQR